MQGSLHILPAKLHILQQPLFGYVTGYAKVMPTTDGQCSVVRFQLSWFSVSCNVFHFNMLLNLSTVVRFTSFIVLSCCLQWRERASGDCHESETGTQRIFDGAYGWDWVSAVCPRPCICVPLQLQQQLWCHAINCELTYWVHNSKLI